MNMVWTGVEILFPAAFALRTSATAGALADKMAGNGAGLWLPDSTFLALIRHSLSNKRGMST